MSNITDYIEIVGAKEHNLKGIDLKIPRNKLVVITGVSGSGKSSLAFDTIYAEGLRRYMETLSSYARQFIGQMERPDVEQVTGLSPVISIEQKTTNKNPRSTVGTVTEIYDFMRLLYARIGEAYSYVTGKKMIKYSEEQIIEHIFEYYSERKIMLLAPLIKGRKGHYRELFEQTRKQGYNKVRIDGELKEVVANMQVDRFKIHDIEVVIDRFTILEDKRVRIAESIQSALKAGNGVLMIMDIENTTTRQYSKHLMCEESGISYEEPSPNTFSFNSPYGSCPTCKGLGEIPEADLDRVIPDFNKSINEVGILPLGEVRENFIFTQVRAFAKKYKFTLDTPIKDIPKEALDLMLYGGGESIVKMPWQQMDYTFDLAKEGLIPILKRWYNETTSEKTREWAADFIAITACTECGGTRLKQESLFFKVGDKNIAELAALDINLLANWFEDIEQHLTERQLMIAKDLLKEIRLRIGFLLHVGLDYLMLNRAARTLSGGESQRIRLATQIGSQLTGVTYILDEPSIGLHQRDNQKLIEALRELADIGNTVLVVEHDKDIMLASDYLIDIGPGAGKNGGQIVGAGAPNQFINNETVTAEYLSHKKTIPIPENRRIGNGHFLILKGANGNNLKKVDIKIPLGTFTVISGVSGSGKSTLINETLYPILRQHFYNSIKKPMPYDEISGLEHLDKVIDIDQSPIGRTPRSNPATYIGVFNDIRKIFSELPEAKIRGYKPGRFSFNVKGGRCEVCEGAGKRVIEMNFLPDVEVDCETCNGRRFNRETLEVLYKGKSISDVLDMTVTEAVTFFEAIPSIYRKVKTLNDVGLGYITLGQQATTLSGGEAQRVKLAEELSKKDTGKTIYILDEPTTGLHFQDIQHLLNVLNKLVEKGNTVLVIEHNMDIIKVADYIIDMGPEGGCGGGIVVGEGTPEALIKLKGSHTAKFLKLEL
jgi:excinuclease ABC subunit A